MNIRNALPAACVVAVMLLLGTGSAIAVSRGVRGTTHANVNRSVDAAGASRVGNASRTVDVNRNVNAGVDPGYGYGEIEHPVAAAVAVASVAAAASAAIGTVAVELPPACEEADVDGVVYLNCSGTWYQPQFDGYQMEYVVVPPPR